MARFLRLAAMAAPLAVAALPEPRSLPAPAQGPLKLVQVQVYFRHGARTPIHKTPPPLSEVEWPKEVCMPSLEEPKKLYLESMEDFRERTNMTLAVRPNGLLPGGCAFGALTNVGQGHATQLGEHLRKKYLEEHGLRITPKDIYVRSTDFPRTIATAQGVTYAMLGDEAMSVPVHVAHLDSEVFIVQWRRCGLLQEMYRSALNELERRRGIDPALQRIAFKLGVVSHDLQVEALIDIIMSRLVHAKEVPILDQSDHVALHDAVVGFYLHRFRATETTLSLVAGPIFVHIGAALEAAARAHSGETVPVGPEAEESGSLFQKTTVRAYPDLNLQLTGAVDATSSPATRSPSSPLATPGPGRTGSAHDPSKPPHNVQQVATSQGGHTFSTKHTSLLPSTSRHPYSIPPGLAITTPPPSTKMHLYAVHDTTLVPMLLALDVFDYQWPRFCANISFELFQDSKSDFFVRVLYNDKVQRIDGLEYTPLAAFRAKLSRHIPRDWEADCSLPLDNNE